MNSGTGGRVRVTPCRACPNPMACAAESYTTCAFYGVAVGPDAEIPGGASGGAGPLRIRVFVRVVLKWLAVTTAGKLLDLAERFMKLYQWLVRVLG